MSPDVKTLAQIAAELQGYDPQALSADDVLAFLSRLVTPVQEAVELPLFEALGRVLAADVVSPFDVPPHDNSAMDGYAFAGNELAPTLPTSCGSLPPEGAELAWGGPARRSLAPGEAFELKVVGTALAGKAWQGSVKAGECVKIMTGAIMPQGLDTVVPQEFVAVQGDVITIPAKLLKPGDNRRLRGEDLAQGKPALLKGELLTPARLGLAASLGLKTLQCWRPLRVAYFSTGDEILSLGEAPREGAVYDSNRYTVFGMLSRLGCQVIDMGVVRDDPALLETAFTSAAMQADAIITSGGVSVGEADFTKTMMKKLGDVAFWRIAMRPGRPMAVGRLLPAKLQAESPPGLHILGATNYKNNSNPNGAILFGLPGNPVAVMVTFLAFVRPALLQMMGASATTQPLLKARSLEAIRKKPGRTEYQRGWVSTAPDGSLQVRTTGNQGSGVLRSMAEANGLMVLHHAQGNIAMGGEVDVLMFDGAI
ncbi:gephyrin-like molybdotransferase Glp [Polaromonas sp.]|uniref:molybdopterin molybdotransferase MoeA n=1 Tax=Polaromonas sp. TaxID=1869339 RepID=UPI003BA92A97